VVAIHFPTRGYRSSAPSWDAITYAELDRRSDAFARGFLAHGLTMGERVVVLTQPNIDFYCFVFGLFKIGVVVVLIDAGMSLKSLFACVQRAKPRAVVASPMVHAITSVYRSPVASADLFVTVGTKWGWGGPTLAECELLEKAAFELPNMQPNRPTAIVFTSGLTGPPKGVRWTQRVFHAQVESAGAMLDARQGRTQVQCSATFALHDICWGHTVVFPAMDLTKPATADPADIVSAINHFRADTAFASSVVWRRVGDFCAQLRLQLPSLEQVISTGPPLPAQVHRQYAPLLKDHTQFKTPYGFTEAIPISNIATHEILGETHAQTLTGAGICVGYAAAGIDIRIIDVTDDPIQAWSDDLWQETGEIGEICVAGAQVSDAYVDLPEANRARKIPGPHGAVFHRTGDLGYFDETGRLWFCGRKAHRIQTHHGMVPTVPIEGLFNDHPQVLRTALVGVGSANSARAVLVVEMRRGQRFDGRLETEIMSRAQGTRWEGVVQRVLVHDAFPVDAKHKAKILRDELKEWATSQCRDLAGRNTPPPPPPRITRGTP
jgi:olefin beta-lactone synthetase